MLQQKQAAAKQAQTVQTVKTAEQIRAEIKALKSLLPTAPPPTQRTVDRREKNAEILKRLNTFAMVVKELRQDLGLPNRVKAGHISGRETEIKAHLLKYCSESLHEKSEKHWYFERAGDALTEIEALKKCGLTDKQYKGLSEKAWRYTNIVDAVVKMLTLSGDVYTKLTAEK